MTEIKKDLAILFAGALASVIGGILFKPPVPYNYILGLGAIVVILILYGSDAISKIYHNYNLSVRKGNRFMAPKVGILNDMPWDLENSDIYTWTDVSPTEWKKEIESQANENKVKIDVKMIDAKKNFDPFIVVINPYGGVYPEYDLKNSATLNKIFSYVKEGGIFVNVADIPGYWAYHPLLNRKLETPSPIYDINRTSGGKISIIPVKPFELTPFMEKLGLKVFGIETQENKKNESFIEPLNWDVEFIDTKNKIIEKLDELKVHRVVIVERNVEPIIKPKRIEQKDMTPFFFVRYGDEGKFLISLVFENYHINSYHPNRKMKEVLADIIIKNIREIKNERRG